MTFQVDQFLIDTFNEEARERIINLSNLVLQLESESDNEDLANEIKREAHTLKGSAKMVGLNDISELAHKMENSIIAFYENSLDFSSLSEIVFHDLDEIARQLGATDLLSSATEGSSIGFDKKATDAKLSNYKAFSLQTAGTVFGSLILINKAENKFLESDLSNIDLVISDFSILLDNSRLHNSIKLLSIIDGLTNVFNHRHFQDLLSIEVDRALRYKQNLSMAMLDIDHFKNFNDTYGHQQGDVILKGVAQIIKDQCRHIDFVSRYGGEEFAIIMPETDLDGAKILCERIRTALEKHDFPGLKGTLNVTASLGVSEIISLKAESPAELIKQADTALYVAKESGRNRMAIYSPDMVKKEK